MKLHVFLVSISGSQGPCGVARHAAGLARALLARHEVARVTLAVGQWQTKYFQAAVGLRDPKLIMVPVEVPNRSVSRNRWYWQDLPRLASSVQADIVHNCFPAPIRRGSFKCPVVTTLHDLYPYDIPENFGYPRVFFNRIFLRQCLRASDAIACVSYETLARLRCHGFSRAARKALVLPNYVDIEREASRPAHPLLDGGQHRFLLFVGQHRANKNIPLLLRCFHKLLVCRDLDPATLLVLAGERGPETAAIERSIEALAIEKNVLMLEGISDGCLRWLYEHAELVLAPSIVEGFGLPVAEALACGARVACSEIPTFREIGGDACFYFDVNQDADEGLYLAARTALQRPARVSAGLARFSLESTADRAVSLYLRLCRARTEAAVAPAHSVN